MLRELAESDHRVVRGWWAVSKEARDAIRNINRKNGWGIRFCALCRWFGTAAVETRRGHSLTRSSTPDRLPEGSAFSRNSGQ